MSNAELTEYAKEMHTEGGGVWQLEFFPTREVASILAATVGSDGFPSERGYTVAFAACAIAVALGVVVGLAIPQRRPADAFAAHEAGELPERVSA